MRGLRIVFLIAAIQLKPPANAQTPTDKPVVRLDPALDALVSPDAKVELVKSGFGFTEGPVMQNPGGLHPLLKSAPRVLALPALALRSSGLCIAFIPSRRTASGSPSRS